MKNPLVEPILLRLREQSTNFGVNDAIQLPAAREAIEAGLAAMQMAIVLLSSILKECVAQLSVEDRELVFNTAKEIRGFNMENGVIREQMDEIILAYGLR